MCVCVCVCVTIPASLSEIQKILSKNQNSFQRNQSPLPTSVWDMKQSRSFGEYVVHFHAMNPWFTLIRRGSFCYGPIYGSNGIIQTFTIV